MVFGLRLRQALRSHHVLHFDVPMPNASAPNAPWVTGVAVAADDGHPGLREPSSGPIMWTMPCSGEFMSNRRTPNSWQFFERFDLRAAIGSVIGVPRGSVGTYGPRWRPCVQRGALAPGGAQTVKGLRRSDLVDQVQVDIENRRPTGRFDNQVRVPDFFKQCACHGHGDFATEIAGSLAILYTRSADIVPSLLVSMA